MEMQQLPVVLEESVEKVAMLPLINVSVNFIIFIIVLLEPLFEHEV